MYHCVLTNHNISFSWLLEKNVLKKIIVDKIPFSHIDSIIFKSRDCPFSKGNELK